MLIPVLENNKRLNWLLGRRQEAEVTEIVSEFFSIKK
jgi:hypothetical protein